MLLAWDHFPLEISLAASLCQVISLVSSLLSGPEFYEERVFIESHRHQNPS
jgi:hypothetical protein